MIKIAIVEDNAADRDTLQAFLERYSKEKKVPFEIKCFSDGDFFITEKTPYDLIFLDIEMPRLNGMDTAKYVRNIDRRVKIAFVTNVTQYAVEGYSVEACAYFVKPLLYDDFALKFVRILNTIERDDNKTIEIKDTEKTVYLPLSEIFYLEVMGHYITYHTEKGNFVSRETLREAEKKFASFCFARTGNSYIVNLAHVEQVDGEIVTVHGEKIKISRSRRQEFLFALAAFFGGGS